MNTLSTLARTVLAASTMLVLTACSLAPTEHRPTIDVSATYREADAAIKPMPGEELGQWVPAQPADEQKPSPWWTTFGDPVLVQLEERALTANPDVAIAMARIKRARALSSRAESARYPSLDVGFGPTRQRTSGAAAFRGDGAPGIEQTLWRAQGTVAYEADVFGRVASDVAAARASSAEQQALSHQMLLIVQADVASTYFTLRQLEGERRLLADTVAIREAGVALLERKRDLGAAAAVVVDQAQAELSAARAEQATVEQDAALAHHALAVLLGQAPAAFTFAAAPLENVSVHVAEGLPSTLLERRPDVAAAERSMAADNARIGVARAAYFPSLSLTGAFGYESSELGNLTNWSQRTFLLGPLVGTALSLPIFDGGKRKADVARARADYEESVGAYRKTVLNAFREVEDALASTRSLDTRLANERDAEEAAARVASSVKTRFDEGDVDYLAVVDAERTLLRNRQARLQSEGARVRASVDLVRALGGGWHAPESKGSVQ
ncbi:efflux transporter outer membrane subunit [Luteibacter yeojuensis]|uniref:Efflux transporter outer membrane subunit n=1 Tax=Luteibacter yeojuensis TaxID=345309 RepID=A0A7X5TR65_9GAMM|nr:efflux transporter outer membrane subunit [Luteibacter yeojuensis]NID16835.1 efflux transporter outer membrane subunit [Luteibacter yeojuensis]